MKAAVFLRQVKGGERAQSGGRGARNPGRLAQKVKHLHVGPADAAEDAVQDGRERPIAVEDMAAHQDLEHVFTDHTNSPSYGPGISATFCRPRGDAPAPSRRWRRHRSQAWRCSFDRPGTAGMEGQGLRMPVPGHAAVAAQVSAAAVINCVTSAGWETMATWLEGTSMVVAPMRLANSRSASGGMAWSWVATRYQDGSDFQAGTPITSVKVEPAKACCTACITLARIGSTSAAK